MTSSRKKMLCLVFRFQNNKICFHQILQNKYVYLNCSLKLSKSQNLKPKNNPCSWQNRFRISRRKKGKNQKLRQSLRSRKWRIHKLWKWIVRLITLADNLETIVSLVVMVRGASNMESFIRWQHSCWETRIPIRRALTSILLTRLWKKLFKGPVMICESINLIYIINDIILLLLDQNRKSVNVISCPIMQFQLYWQALDRILIIC